MKSNEFIIYWIETEYPNIIFHIYKRKKKTSFLRRYAQALTNIVGWLLYCTSTIPT